VLYPLRFHLGECPFSYITDFYWTGNARMDMPNKSNSKTTPGVNSESLSTRTDLRASKGIKKTRRPPDAPKVPFQRGIENLPPLSLGPSLLPKSWLSRPPNIPRSWSAGLSIITKSPSRSSIKR